MMSSMAFLRKFLIELVFVAILVGWIVAKFPEAITPWVPWLCLLVFWHLVRELFPKRWILSTAERSRTMIYLVAFMVGGALSTLLVWSVQQGLNKLEKTEVKTRSFATLVPIVPAWTNSPIPMDNNIQDPHVDYYRDLV